MTHTASQWRSIAQENIFFEYVDNTPFAYGTKEACLKLFKKFNKGTAEYTPVYNCWFYTTYEDIFIIK